MGSVVSVNISEKKGTIKKPVPRIVVTSTGIESDAHAALWHRQISLLSKESIDSFSKASEKVFRFGEFAENITIHGIDLTKVKLRDRFHIGEVVLEVSQIGKECHGGGCAIFREVGKCVMPKEGIFAKVIKPGSIEPGCEIVHESRPLKLGVITLSDRASRGEYEDRSGPTISKLMQEHFSASHWNVEITNVVIPDDGEKLRAAIAEMLKGGADILFTTGGTGIGPRDITPDIVGPMLTKVIPGIMELIRVKYGTTIPSACLSRSIAGLIDQTLVYVLPGSVKAVTEYVSEIRLTLNHSLLMLMGIDNHR
jgi:molybdopterin adenylyltransferase